VGYRARNGEAPGRLAQAFLDVLVQPAGAL
jgi:hypothetical protein